jgi:DNA-binding CsgD family transcriptional regulator
MYDHLPLDSRLSQFYDGEITKKELEEFIFKYILNNYRDFYPDEWEEEECADFLCWFYPRLSRAINTYRYEGASFTTYIISLIRLNAKRYRIEETDHQFIERAYWSSVWDDMAVRTPEPDYLALQAQAKPFPRVSNRRQALILLLKSYNHVSDNFIARAAPAIGVEEEKLIEMVEKLRDIRFEHDMDARALRERIYGQFFRCKTFERRRNASAKGTMHYQMMQKKLERAERRLENMMKTLRNIKIAASNQQVARILGIPKGTVDSNIHAVKRKPDTGRKKDAEKK